MERIAIGKSGLTTSRIGLGTWAIGGWMWGGSNETQSIATIRSAVERGITLIDTAPAYGFGQSLGRRQPNSHSRERAGTRGGGQAIQIFQSQTAPVEQTLDLSEDDLGEPLGAMERYFFHHQIAFAESDAAEFARRIQGQQPARAHRVSL